MIVGCWADVWPDSMAFYVVHSMNEREQFTVCGSAVLHALCPFISNCTENQIKIKEITKKSNSKSTRI